MFSHIMLGAKDMEASREFYDAVMGTLGRGPGVMGAKGRCFYFSDFGILVLKPSDMSVDVNTSDSITGFVAETNKQVDAWYEAGLLFDKDLVLGPPQLRDAEAGKFYLSYLLDPTGNKLCAMHYLD